MNWNLKSPSRGLAPLAALVVLTATFGCDKKSAEKADSPIVAPKVEKGRVVFPSSSPHLSALQIESARAGTNFSLIFPGKLAWDENVTVRVFSPFGGRIIRVLAEPGSVVEKGKPLAILASADFGQAQADARRARTDIALAERNLTRLRTLLENGAAAQKDLASAEADLERAKAEEERARGRLQLFGVDSFTVDNNFTLKAPLDGILVDKSINPGQEVRADQMLAGVEKLASPLFTITDPTRLWLLLDLTEADASHLTSGDTLTIRTASRRDEVFTGTVDYISDSVDSVTRTVRVRAKVDNKARTLRADQLVTAEVRLSNPTVDISDYAVFLDGERYFVFIQEDGTSFSKREVRIGRKQGGKIHILSGLKDGEKVVTDGALLLNQILSQTEGT